MITARGRIQRLRIPRASSAAENTMVRRFGEGARSPRKECACGSGISYPIMEACARSGGAFLPLTRTLTAHPAATPNARNAAREAQIVRCLGRAALPAPSRSSSTCASSEASSRRIRASAASCSRFSGRFDAATEQGPHIRRNASSKRFPVGGLRQDRRKNVADGLAREEAMARQHLEEHDPERPDVGALVDGLSSRLLRAHIRRGAEDETGLGGVARHRGGVRELRVHPAAAVLALEGFGQTKVQNLYLAVGGYLDVGGFEIAMDDAVVVRFFESFRDLLRDGDGFIDGDGTTLKRSARSSPRTISIARK